MEEKWVGVSGFKNRYTVSDRGRVRGLMSGGILKPWLSNSGYLTVKLKVKGQRYSRYVHALVARAFIGPRPRGFLVNHKNGHKLNNSRKNLEYLSRSDSMYYDYKMGFRKGHCPKASIEARRRSVIQISKQGKPLRVFFSINEAARVVGGWNQNIGKACRGEILTASGFHWKYTKKKVRFIGERATFERWIKAEEKK